MSVQEDRLAYLYQLGKEAALVTTEEPIDAYYDEYLADLYQLGKEAGAGAGVGKIFSSLFKSGPVSKTGIGAVSGTAKATKAASNIARAPGYAGPLPSSEYANWMATKHGKIWTGKGWSAPTATPKFVPQPQFARKGPF